MYRPSGKLNRDNIRTFIDVGEVLANNNGVNIIYKVVEDETYYWNSDGYKVMFILTLKGEPIYYWANSPYA